MGGNLVGARHTVRMADPAPVRWSAMPQLPPDHSSQSVETYVDAHDEGMWRALEAVMGRWVNCVQQAGGWTRAGSLLDPIGHSCRRDCVFPNPFPLSLAGGSMAGSITRRLLLNTTSERPCEVARGPRRQRGASRCSDGNGVQSGTSSLPHAGARASPSPLDDD